jgi:hypothetical protein
MNPSSESANILEEEGPRWMGWMGFRNSGSNSAQILRKSESHPIDPIHPGPNFTAAPTAGGNASNRPDNLSQTRHLAPPF